MRKKKTIDFFDSFFIFFMKVVSNFFLNSPLTNALRHLLIVPLYVRVSTNQKKPLPIGLDLIILN